MGIARHNEVVVNLVGEDQNVILHAYVDDFSKLGDCPHTADRVMRAAKHQKLCVGLRGLAREILKVHLIASVDDFERILNEGPLAGFYGHLERIVNGRLDNDSIARSRELPYSVEDGRHHTRRSYDPIPLGDPAVVANLPIDYRAVETVGRPCVTERTSVYELVQRALDLRRVGKLHISNGKGDDIRGNRRVLSEHLVPFHGASTASVHAGGEVVLHESPCTENSEID